jgi:hypothetical protein
MPNEKLSLSGWVGDLVIFRNLNPIDSRLPRFDEAWPAIGLPGPARPRKHESAYARAIAWMLQGARDLDRPGTRLEEILYMGDTALSDGNAFRNLRTAGGWRGWAFIGAERDADLSMTEEDGVCVANHWSALVDFAYWLREQGATLDERTAVIVDIDKTALGARGRNDRAIDGARTAAMQIMISGTLGPCFDPELFHETYRTLDVAKYHSFTADNQDYLAYICLVVNARLYGLDRLLADLADGHFAGFAEFLNLIDSARSEMAPVELRALHDEVVARVKAGDPTPFKAFRRQEYLETVSRMGNLPEDVPGTRRMAEEICLTREVLDVLSWLRERGCLVLALSDKPDEASVPSPELASEGYLPLHRALTHVTGQSITDRLPNI